MVWIGVDILSTFHKNKNVILVIESTPVSDYVLNLFFENLID